MTFQFKIQLQNVSKPTVWRRVLVPSEITFDDFHYIIQDAFGWESEHLYSFSPSGYGSSPLIEINIEDDENDFFLFFREIQLNRWTPKKPNFRVFSKKKDRHMSISTILVTIGSTRSLWKKSMKQTTLYQQHYWMEKGPVHPKTVAGRGDMKN